VVEPGKQHYRQQAKDDYTGSPTSAHRIRVCVLLRHGLRD
jgi:hypothetical protein